MVRQQKGKRISSNIRFPLFILGVGYNSRRFQGKRKNNYMATLVLNRDSLSVKLEANHLVIHEHAEDGPFRRMPLVDIERVIVVGQPAITFPVLAKIRPLMRCGAGCRR